MKKPILYSFYRGSSWRVRIALAYKRIDYEYRAVNIMEGEQHTPRYRAVNGMGKMPSLTIDGASLTESLAIIEYLDETRPARKLLPKDPIQRAHARRLAEIINSGIHPLQTKGIFTRVSQYSGQEDDKARWAHEMINSGFKGLEVELGKTTGIYSVGNEVTIADCFLVPQVYNAKRFNVDMTQFPNISRVNENLLKIDAFVETAPEYQPDCPEELRKVYQQTPHVFGETESEQMHLPLR